MATLAPILQKDDNLETTLARRVGTFWLLRPRGFGPKLRGLHNQTSKIGLSDARPEPIARSRSGGKDATLKGFP